MKKQWLLLSLQLLTSLYVSGQDNFFQPTGRDNSYPSNFPMTKGVSMAIVRTTCKVCNPIRSHELSGANIFDRNGYNIVQYDIFKGKKWGMQKFIWNSDGTIDKYQNYNSFQGTLDPLNDTATYENDYGMRWDSTSLSNEVRYSYDSGRLKTISGLSGDSLRINSLTTFSYNAQGMEIREETVYYLDSALLVLGFKPNSSEPLGLPDYKAQTKDLELFSYSGDSVYMKFYHDGQISGTGKRRLNDRNQVLYQEIFDLSGKSRSRFINTYNSLGLLVDQKRFDTGYDGYGVGSDFVGYDGISYQYDDKGRLKSFTQYYENNMEVVDTFEYK